MIEKLVALIREKHRDNDSLVLADVLEQYGGRVANEIVGAALCHLFGFDSPPDQGVIFNKASVSVSASQFASLELGIQTYLDPADPKFHDLKKTIQSRLQSTIYGGKQHMTVMTPDGKIQRVDMEN